MRAITSAQIEATFQREIAPDFFPGTSVPGGRPPHIVFLGGQPAAGKTSAQQAIADRYGPWNPVVITGDEFRKFHPEYRSLVQHDQLAMPGTTQALSGPLVGRCLDEAQRRGCDVILEGTFRDADMVNATVDRFAADGYDVTIAGVATPEWQSRLDAENRYLYAGTSQARWTPPTAHDSAFVMMPHTLASLENNPNVTNVLLFTRDGQTVYENHRTDTRQWQNTPGVASALHAARSRPPTELEAREWIEEFNTAYASAVDRQNYLQPATAPAWRRLLVDADTMAAHAWPPNAETGRPLSYARHNAAQQQRSRTIEAAGRGEGKPVPATTPGERLNIEKRTEKLRETIQALKNRHAGPSAAHDRPAHLDGPGIEGPQL